MDTLGVVLGTLFGVLVLAVIGVWYWKKRTSRNLGTIVPHESGASSACSTSASVGSMISTSSASSASSTNSASVASSTSSFTTTMRIAPPMSSNDLTSVNSASGAIVSLNPEKPVTAGVDLPQPNSQDHKKIFDRTRDPRKICCMVYMNYKSNHPLATSLEAFQYTKNYMKEYMPDVFEEYMRSLKARS
jgi:hypothetical protein